MRASGSGLVLRQNQEAYVVCIVGDRQRFMGTVSDYILVLLEKDQIQ